MTPAFRFTPDCMAAPALFACSSIAAFSFCYRTENMSELSCDGIPPGKMEADAQWYPFVMVTKPDDWRRPCHQLPDLSYHQTDLAHALHTRRDSHDERHLNTLALLICGIVSARHVQFALIADHVPIRGARMKVSSPAFGAG
jgi:hypothetical protein